MSKHLTPTEHGKAAFTKNATRAPYLDEPFMNNHVDGRIVGSAAPLLKEWLQGWDDAQEVQLRINFPEMYTS